MMEIRKRMDDNEGVEENTMAILNTSGFNKSKMSHHLNNDRLAFLEAVRTASLLPEHGNAPTGKMYDAVFHILRDEDSLELLVQSFQLLVELDKRFPPLCLLNEEQHNKVVSKLIMVEEAWSPFTFGLEEVGNQTRSALDSSGIHSLIKEVARSDTLDIKFLKKVLLLQYLISVIEGDFTPRNSSYQESMDWTLLRESLLNILLGSRKIIYKDLIKDCLYVMCQLSQSNVLSDELRNDESSSDDISHENIAALTLAISQAKKSACTLLKKLFAMMMGLDLSRRLADQKYLTSRADGGRTPVIQIILDEILYENDIFSSFLQVFNEPKWKLGVIVQYFQKYIPKSVKTRRSSDTFNIENFGGVLKCLATKTGVRSIIKKLNTEVVQLLLAHGFQAYLMQSNQRVSDAISDPTEDVESGSIVEICKNMISAFTCLKKEDKGLEILCLSKQAIFTAATIISNKSL